MHDLMKEYTCDICGAPYMAPADITLFGGESGYQGDYVTYRKQMGGYTESKRYNLCPFCATKVMQRIENLKKEEHNG
jgi:DNA-directed RNA polymerase subunit RPC12/RpoP